jgi:hypothetical protein
VSGPEALEEHAVRLAADVLAAGVQAVFGKVPAFELVGEVAVLVFPVAAEVEVGF